MNDTHSFKKMTEKSDCNERQGKEYIVEPGKEADLRREACKMMSDEVLYVKCWRGRQATWRGQSSGSAFRHRAPRRQ